MSELRKAAQALVDRWDTPLWKEAPHTGTFIDALRAALARPEPLEPAGEEDMKVYAAIAEGYGRLEKRIGCVQHDCDVCQARALAQPEQEPVAWRYDEATYRPNDLRGRQWHFTLFSTRKPYADEMVQNVTPLYTAPPQRKPLTDDEIEALADAVPIDEMTLRPSTWHLRLARAIERAHGIGV